MLKRKRETEVEVKRLREYRSNREAMRSLRDSVSALLDARSAQPPRTVDTSQAAACQRYAHALRALEQRGLLRIPTSSATFQLEYNTTKTRARLVCDSDRCRDADVQRQVECATELYDDLLDRSIEEMIYRDCVGGPQRADDAISHQLLALARQVDAMQSRPRDTTLTAGRAFCP